MSDYTTTYTIRSVKQSEEFRGTLAEAIARALQIDEEYQPAFGVDVCDADGQSVAEIDSDDNEIAD